MFLVCEKQKSENWEREIEGTTSDKKKEENNFFRIIRLITILYLFIYFCWPKNETTISATKRKKLTVHRFTHLK